MCTSHFIFNFIVIKVCCHYKSSHNNKNHSHTPAAYLNGAASKLRRAYTYAYACKCECISVSELTHSHLHYKHTSQVLPTACCMHCLLHGCMVFGNICSRICFLLSTKLKFARLCQLLQHYFAVGNLYKTIHVCMCVCVASCLHLKEILCLLGIFVIVML